LLVNGTQTTVARGRYNKGITRFAYVGDRPIHRLGNLVRGMARKILSQRIAIQTATGLLGATRQAFRALKDLVGNGNGYFHTKGMTRRFPYCND
jgi:hypothetical protein